MSTFAPIPDLSKAFYAYELVDPRTSKVFYVGKGSLRFGRKSRFNDHLAKARRGLKGVRYNIIRALLATGRRPTLNIFLEGVDEASAYAAECRRIKYHGLDNLANASQGGEGGPVDVQTGDSHWTRRHPEKVLRGDQHPSHLHPESRPRGKNHGRHTKPGATARGERHGMAKLTLVQVTRIRDAYSSAVSNGLRINGRDLAAKFEVAPVQVSRILRGNSWGLPSLIERHGNSRLTTEQHGEIRARRKAGDGYAKIAATFGVTTNAIFWVCNPDGSKAMNKTDRPGNAKLTEAQITEMSNRYLNREATQAELARDFGVSRSQIIRIFKSRGVVLPDKTRRTEPPAELVQT